jgi:hypothetical protein
MPYVEPNDSGWPAACPPESDVACFTVPRHQEGKGRNWWRFGSAALASLLLHLLFLPIVFCVTVDASDQEPGDPWTALLEPIDISYPTTEV